MILGASNRAAIAAPRLPSIALETSGSAEVKVAVSSFPKAEAGVWTPDLSMQRSLGRVVITGCKDTEVKFFAARTVLLLNLKVLIISSHFLWRSH